MNKYKINKGIEINELDNELVVIIPKTEKMYYCNKLSKDIVYHIRDGFELSQIIDALLEKYDVEYEILKSDLDETLSKLMESQIIVSEE